MKTTYIASTLILLLSLILSPSKKSFAASKTTRSGEKEPSTQKFLILPEDIILKGNEGGNGGNGEEILAYSSLNLVYRALKLHYKDLVMKEAYNGLKRPNSEKLESLLGFFINLKNVKLKVQREEKQSKVLGNNFVLSPIDLKKLRASNPTSKAYFCTALDFSLQTAEQSSDLLDCDTLYPYHEIFKINYLLPDTDLIKHCEAKGNIPCSWNNASFTSIEKSIFENTNWPMLGNLYKCESARVKQQRIRAKSLHEAQKTFILNQLINCDNYDKQSIKQSIDLRISYNSIEDVNCKLAYEDSNAQLTEEYNFIRKSLAKSVDENKLELTKHMSESNYSELLRLLNIDPNLSDELNLEIVEAIQISGITKDFQNIKLENGKFILKARRNLLSNLSASLHSMSLLLHEYLGFLSIEVNHYQLSTKLKTITSRAIQNLGITDPEQVSADYYHRLLSCGPKGDKWEKIHTQQLYQSLVDTKLYPNERNRLCITAYLIQNIRAFEKMCSPDGNSPENEILRYLKKAKLDISNNISQQSMDYKELSKAQVNCNSSAYDRNLAYNSMMGMATAACHNSN